MTNMGMRRLSFVLMAVTISLATPGFAMSQPGEDLSLPGPDQPPPIVIPPPVSDPGTDEPAATPDPAAPTPAAPSDGARAPAPSAPAPPAPAPSDPPASASQPPDPGAVVPSAPAPVPAPTATGEGPGAPVPDSPRAEPRPERPAAERELPTIPRSREDAAETPAFSERSDPPLLRVGPLTNPLDLVLIALMLVASAVGMLAGTRLAPRLLGGSPQSETVSGLESAAVIRAAAAIVGLAALFFVVFI